MRSVEFFKAYSYLPIEGIISPKMAHFLYQYVKQNAYRLSVLENMDKDMNDPILREFHGIFDDSQAPGDFSKYGDPTFDTLMCYIKPQLEVMTELKLTETYSYHRLYTTGTELVRHKDRPSCEISMTLCLVYDIMNLPKDQQEWNWPMWVHTHGEDKEVFMKPGDGIIYRGCDIEHWRLPYIGNNHAQVFLHYNSESENKFDNRPYVGLPGSYRSK